MDIIYSLYIVNYKKVYILFKLIGRYRYLVKTNCQSIYYNLYSMLKMHDF